MKVFISWSGPRSRAIAEALRNWLPCVVQACNPWMSSSDIEAGVRWGSTLANELQQTRFGILCLTPENLTAPWLLFEAGALSKIVDESNVCPLLLDIQPTDITGPLAQFQSVKADKEGIRNLVRAINRSLGDQARNETVVDKVFDVFWTDFEASIIAVPKSSQETVSLKRQPEDILNEILETVRNQARQAILSSDPHIPSKDATYAISLIKSETGLKETALNIILDLKRHPDFSNKFVILECFLSFGWPDFIILLKGKGVEALKDGILIIREKVLEGGGGDLETSSIICSSIN